MGYREEWFKHNESNHGWYTCADGELITLIEAKGLAYGEHVISFQREYLKCCEKFFHNLGK